MAITLPKNEDTSVSKIHLRGLFYGEPGVGKTFFAKNAPKPLFLSTDGNYVHHGKPTIPISSMNDFIEATNLILKGGHTFETIVVDLLEDVYSFYRDGILADKKVDHESDLAYGKGWDLVRNTFLIDLFKLLSCKYSVILISHSTMVTVKDRKGIEHHHFRPSNFLPEKVLDSIEGRMTYVLRAFYEFESVDEHTEKIKRYLSLIPKENEYGVFRAPTLDGVPANIDLDWNEFIKWTEYTGGEVTTKPSVNKPAEKKTVTPKPTEKKVEPKVEEKPVETKTEETKVEEAPVERKLTIQEIIAAKKARSEVKPQEEVKEVEEVVEEKKVEVKPSPVKTDTSTPKPKTNEEIKAYIDSLRKK